MQHDQGPAIGRAEQPLPVDPQPVRALDRNVDCPIDPQPLLIDRQDPGRVSHLGEDPIRHVVVRGPAGPVRKRDR